MLIEDAWAPPRDTEDVAFERFFREQFGRVYGLLYRVTGDVAAAEDLAQEVFLQVAQRQPPLWERPEASGWLWRAATHAALNALRSERRRLAREERAARDQEPARRAGEWAQDPARGAERREQQAAFRAVLRRLKPRDSALLLLRHSGLSYAEVARALGLNPASVGTLLARAEQRFKEHWLSEPSR